MIDLTEKLTRDIYDEDFDGNTLEDIRIPAEGYGKESWVTYTYVLDKKFFYSNKFRRPAL